MFLRQLITLTLTGLLLFTSGSTASSTEPDTGTSKEAGIHYFETHIRPLLAERCYECHSQRTKKRMGGLWLDHPSGWEQGGDHGSGIVPGDVAASLLIRAVRYDDPDLQMPPEAPLPAESIARLEHWVRMGAPAPIEAQPRGNQPSDPIAGKNHWAFRPFTNASPPAVQRATWPRSNIDRFVLARLEHEQLSPVADASPRDLARRIFFQLIGLPPTASQIASFLQDDRPDRLERLVDRLLQSPHFGERWGRHWLDLARYADSNGLDENFLFREAWRYRNWVIHAINEDLPFDQFLTAQIAGDLLPFDSIEERDQQRIAAGFMVLGPKVLLGNDPRKQRMEIADEQIDTIGRAILGQTLGCARCHDHKFDPIPTADYYALAGILTSTRVMERRYMLGQQRVMEQLVGLGPDGDQYDDAYEAYWRQQPKLKQRTERAKSGLELLKKEDSAALAEMIKSHQDAFAESARDSTRTVTERIAVQEAFLAELVAKLADVPAIPPRAMIPMDVKEPADESIRLAGQFDRPGDQIPRGFLQVLCVDEQAARGVPENQSGRLALARWLTDAQRPSGQLAARVYVNRVWHHLMGFGLVRTVDNFGRTGETPSHPELLDFLAREWVASGRSLKALVRQIVLSRTFALSSVHDVSNHERDPENRWLWRAHRRRLEPESLRDALLLTAGRLDVTPMDSTVWYLGDQATAVGDNKVRRRTDFPCRSVYLPVIRNDLPELFDVFDFANPHTTTGARPKTTVPTQSLFMLNDDLVMDVADTMAQRLLMESTSEDFPSDPLITKMFESILTVPPSDSERNFMNAFLQNMARQFESKGGALARQRALAIACHALFASSRFQYLE